MECCYNGWGALRLGYRIVLEKIAQLNPIEVSQALQCGNIYWPLSCLNIRDLFAFEISIGCHVLLRKTCMMTGMRQSLFNDYTR